MSLAATITPAHVMRGPRAALAGAPWELRYMGVPFVDFGRSFDAADCWGLVLLILEHERGVRVREPAELYASTDIRDAELLRDYVADEIARWRRVPEPQPWSVLLFGILGRSGRLIPAHVGLVRPAGGFIHTQARRGVQMANLTAAERGESRWGERLMGAYVYDG